MGNDIKKYLFVTTHMPPDYKYGGVVESGSKLYKYISKLCNLSVSTVAANPDKFYDLNQYKGKCYKSRILHRYGFSLSSIFGLLLDVYKADRIYINGIFTFPVTLSAIYSIFFNKYYVVSIRGGLESWRMNQNKRVKQIFYYLFIRVILSFARYIHVTSVAEEASLRALGFSQVINISNGIDLDFISTINNNNILAQSKNQKFTFLFMSRTDKEKGIDILLEAYEIFCNKFHVDGHQLLIVGPDNLNYLRNLKIDYKKRNILRHDAIYGLEKYNCLQTASILILPSYSENFGNIIAEALAVACPVITTNGTPWECIIENNCGWYISPNAIDLYHAMVSSYTVPRKKLKNMGLSGRDLIFKNFSWEVKARELYNYLNI